MYQSMSPEENLGLSSVRKSNNSHLKSSKDDESCSENGRISSNGNTSTLTPPTLNQHQNEHEEEEEHGVRHENSPSRDVLLQWGQRKRSRCSRTESRSMGATTSEKLQTTTMAMTMTTATTTTTSPLLPPSVDSTFSNGGCTIVSGRKVNSGLLYLLSQKNRGLHFAKDSNPKNRNVSSDQMVCSNGASPSRNGVGSSSRATISRSSIGKRSPSCVAEKNDKRSSSVSASMRKVKSDDSLGNGTHHLQGESAEQENNNGGHHHHHQVAAEAGEKANNGEVVELPRIYLSLSRKEKEDDFYAMKGTKLPHRPKKRAKAVDRALQYCFPGLWLSDLTRARYEVRERKSAKKPKRRGLKGLENMESESE